MGEKNENFLEEKQERREFLKKLGKTALPAIALLGLCGFGSRLQGIQETVNSRRKTPMTCESGCSGGCEGSCRGTCAGGCADACSGTCKGDCTGSCRGDCSGSSRNASSKKTVKGTAKA